MQKTNLSESIIQTRKYSKQL